MANDSILKAVHLAVAADVRRSQCLQRILPKQLGVYAKGCSCHNHVASLSTNRVGILTTSLLDPGQFCVSLF